MQAHDLWDDGYANSYVNTRDDLTAPYQSSGARFVFQTDAASVTVVGHTTIYNSYPQYAHLGVYVDGVAQAPLSFAANGTGSFSLSLGDCSILHTVELVAGAQSQPEAAVIGSYINSVTYPHGASFTVLTPSVGQRILVYGDSISVGANATNPETEGYVPLLRHAYDYCVMLEGWGYRSLHTDTNSVELCNAFVSRVAAYAPAVIWLAIGTNDYGLNRWDAASFGNAYTHLVDDLHVALPDTPIICQTPLIRSDESANASGSTLNDYRDQISAICGTRSWATLVDGKSILTTVDLADGVHPSTEGHAKYAASIAALLATLSVVPQR